MSPNLTEPHSQFDPIGDQQDLAALPIFAQLLVACRLIRRAVLATIEFADSQTALQVCDHLETICVSGQLERLSEVELNRAFSVQPTDGNHSTIEALQGVARAVAMLRKQTNNHHSPANTHQLDMLNIVRQCVATISSEPRFSQLQLAIMLNSDIDQIAFCCTEANIARTDGMTVDVLHRLTPCHPISLFELPRCLEDEYR